MFMFCLTLLLQIVERKNRLTEFLSDKLEHGAQRSLMLLCEMLRSSVCSCDCVCVQLVAQYGCQGLC